MRKRYLVWAALILTVLFIGWLIGSRLAPPVEAETQETSTSTSTFRAWFWERRTLDLLAQVGLIFAGALGVAALLPGHRGIREMRSRIHETDMSNEEPHAPMD
ncbi:MAG: hypothetical protein ACLFTI_04165 [Anaerolineales bacterium]